jgi:hypothetical protein
MHAARKKTWSDAGHFGCEMVKEFGWPDIMFAPARKGL